MPWPSSGDAAWKPIFAQAFAIWLGTRLAFIVFTYFAVMLRTDGRVYGYISVPPEQMFQAWRQWDAVWYLHIAQWGYWRLQSAAFFPLYPLLIKVFSFLTGGHWLAAALIVSNLSTLGAFFGLGLLAHSETGSRSKTWYTLQMTAAYPLAFFLAAPYTEGLFLCFATFTLYFARQGRWRSAAICAFLGAMTRPTGVVLILPLAWEYARQHDWFDRERWRRGALRKTLDWPTLREFVPLMVAVPAAVVCFALVLQIRFAQPLLFVHVQATYWQRITMSPLASLSGAIGQVFSMPMWSFWQARDLIDLVAVLVFGGITLFNLRRLPVSFSLYLAGVLYLTVYGPVLLSPDPDWLVSAGRFLLVAAPVFVLIGSAVERRPWLYSLLLSAGFLLQALFAAYFLSGGWII